ncbi:unnamed protein product [Somion occarium]|uniref:Phosphatidate cytidylyltransferase n=2 Tax=Somion occarium TaxID=3059160 RepID=A0ABP1DF53_9APHY
MSRPVSQTSQPSWTSKTTFDALGVESGEETDEESVQESVLDQQSLEPPKPTKSALKKAKTLARIERRKQERAKARSAQVTPTLTDDLASSVDELPRQAHRPNGTVKHVSTETRTVNGQAPPPAPAEEELERASSSKPPSSEIVQSKANGHVQEESKPLEHELTPVPEEQPIPPPSAPVEEKKTPSQLSVQNVQNGHAYAPVVENKQMDLAQAEKSKKLQNALTRTVWTVIMIGGFLGLLAMGHVYMIILVMLCQTLVYREVTSLFSLKRKGDTGETPGRDPWSKTLNWYFFAVTNYFLYGESIIHYFKHVVFSDAQLAPFATNHRMISFALYTIGFVGFVMSLQRGYLKQQFGLFCWVHMTLLLIVVSSHFIVNNILEGMIWFWVPASLVICNDVFAYIWGITLGRTPLIKLSPKKTVEGFVGAFFSTVVFGIIWGTFFMRFDYMICPVRELGVSAFDTTVHCKPNPVFVWRDWNIPAPLSALLSTLLGRAITSIPYAPYQIHLFFMACFASLVAPFGGFFASGFKRAFNIKDFGHSIPGHGGMTDRMDCQFLMGVFTYVYYSNLIRETHVTVGSVLQTIVNGLTFHEQMELIADLKRYLEGQGIRVNV